MIYFDNAATTFPKPLLTQKSAMQGIRFYGGNPGRSGHRISELCGKKVYEVRTALAQFVHCAPEEIAFTCNCTYALNMAIKGVMAEGGHILLSDMEHNSVYRPIVKMAEKGWITYDIVPIVPGNTEETLQNFAQRIRPDTKAVVCTHASNVTGYILPIAQIGSLCQQMNVCFIVDFAQTAGIIPIDMEAMCVNVGCFAGHKSLYGITGTGFMAVREQLEFETLIEGGTGSVSLQTAQPDFMPDRWESGTLPTVGIMSLHGGLQYISQWGLAAIYDKEYHLCQMLYRALGEMPNIETYQGDFAYGAYVPVVLFNVKGKDSTEVAFTLNRLGFAVRGGLHCAPLTHQKLGTVDRGAVRVSVQYANHAQQMQALLQAVKTL